MVYRRKANFLAYARPRVAIHGLRVSGVTDSDGCEIRCPTRILFVGRVLVQYDLRRGASTRAVGL
jgi:hypothetical protein